MKYVLVDCDGELHVRSGDWQPELGVHGFDRVDLSGLDWPLTGFVSDRGHDFPDTYPRNLMGSLVLCCLNAVEQPYAGPVVITGWEASEGYVLDMDEELGDRLMLLHADIRHALAGDPFDDGDKAEWAMVVRWTADYLRSCGAPTAEVISHVDAERG